MKDDLEMKRLVTMLMAGFFVREFFGWFQVRADEYKEALISNGGKITGKVTLNGGVPSSRAFPLILYPFGSYCKKISDGKGNVVINEFNIGPDKGLQDTVIAIHGITEGKVFPNLKAEYVATDCMFHPADVSNAEQFEVKDGKLIHIHPSVAVFRNNQRLTVVNKDPIFHNGQVFQSERGNIVLNFPLPISNEAFGGIVHLRPGKTITQMICGMHEFMQSWGYQVDNPYYARTKIDGLFEIGEIPPGQYTVTAWHPHFKSVEKTIVVGPNQALNIDFSFNSSDIKHANYEIQEKFRIGPDAHQHNHENLKECSPPYC